MCKDLGVAELKPVCPSPSCGGAVVQSRCRFNQQMLAVSCIICHQADSSLAAVVSRRRDRGCASFPHPFFTVARGDVGPPICTLLHRCILCLSIDFKLFIDHVYNDVSIINLPCVFLELSIIYFQRDPFDQPLKSLLSEYVHQLGLPPHLGYQPRGWHVRRTHKEKQKMY